MEEKYLRGPENPVIISSPDARWPLYEIRNASHHLDFKNKDVYASFTSLAIDPDLKYFKSDKSNQQQLSRAPR